MSCAKWGVCLNIQRVLRRCPSLVAQRSELVDFSSDSEGSTWGSKRFVFAILSRSGTCPALRALVRAHERAFLPNISLRKAGFQRGEAVETKHGIGTVEEDAEEGGEVHVKFHTLSQPGFTQFETYKAWQVSPRVQPQPEELPPILPPQLSLRI